MEEEKRQKITINIHGTDIRVEVPAADEERWRKAAKLINEKINAYFGSYKGARSEEEINYFIMIDLALKYLQETERNEVSPITEVLSKLSSEIDEAIK